MPFRFRSRNVEDHRAQQNFEQLERYLDHPNGIWRRTSAQSIANTTHTPIVWEVSDHDPLSMCVAGTPTRVTVPEAGTYMVIGQVQWAGWYNRNIVGIWVNGAGTTRGWRSEVSGSAFPLVQASSLIRLAAGEFVELVVWQNSGGSVNIPAGATEDATRFAVCLVSRT